MRLTIFALGLLLILICYVCKQFSWLDPIHTKAELIENYEQRREKILEVKRYFNSVVPRSKNVQVEFESDSKIGRFGIYSMSDSNDYGDVKNDFLGWDLTLKTKKMDSLLTVLGWSNATLKEIKTKLDNAGCISIESGEPSTIGFKRSGMGILLYKIFDAPIPGDSIRPYNDSCSYILYKPTVVLEYQGGVIGSQCFPKE